MNDQYPKVNVEILVIKNNKLLLGLLSKKWSKNSQQLFGVPGRDVYFGEKIGDSVKRNIREEIGCLVKNHKIICVNANRELGNHYIGIGVIVEIKGPIKLLKPEDWEKWKWFEINKIPVNLFASAKYLIDCYLNSKINVSE